jgi:hypothetical protein
MKELPPKSLDESQELFKKAIEQNKKGNARLKEINKQPGIEQKHLSLEELAL